MAHKSSEQSVSPGNSHISNKSKTLVLSVETFYYKAPDSDKKAKVGELSWSNDKKLSKQLSIWDDDEIPAVPEEYHDVFIRQAPESFHGAAEIGEFPHYSLGNLELNLNNPVWNQPNESTKQDITEASTTDRGNNQTMHGDLKFVLENLQPNGADDSRLSNLPSGKEVVSEAFNIFISSHLAFAKEYATILRTPRDLMRDSQVRKKNHFREFRVSKKVSAAVCYLLRLSQEPQYESIVQMLKIHKYAIPFHYTELFGDSMNTSELLPIDNQAELVKSVRSKFASLTEKYKNLPKTPNLQNLLQKRASFLTSLSSPLSKATTPLKPQTPDRDYLDVPSFLSVSPNKICEFYTLVVANRLNRSEFVVERDLTRPSELLRLFVLKCEGVERADMKRFLADYGLRESVADSGV